MPIVLCALSPSPARVHERARALTGHQPCWIRRGYRGGVHSIEHFRICSYCGCIHPLDMILLLGAGGSRLRPSGKPGKTVFLTPNPIAGELVQIGSLSGPVFEPKHWPARLRDRLMFAPRAGLPFEPSISERLNGHFERPCLEPAPAMIEQPFFDEHTTELQWADIRAAAAEGESKHALSSP